MLLSTLRQDNESPTGSTSGNQLEDRSIDGNKDEDEDEKIQSDAESESLLSPVSHEVTMAVIPTMVLFKPESIGEGSSPDQSPVHSPAEHAAGPPVPQQSSAESPPSSSPAPPITICVSLLSPPSRPMAPPSEPEPSLDSSTFWKSCNAAGCTQALFTGFINEMNDISSRIQSDLASQEDYDLALSVMNASGKLAELVAKQQEELQRKQTELQKATAVIKEVSQR
ncbi:uncharacterized protein LOC129104671 isoform X1 [Anoplopoma fimbria]|uniref:uncharacterized protein LOC129104671 isoform X1 n=1 Tax=Anoplopoma fimbria TaxID=229290 RepID=UPI0023EDBAC4|nr:uncharacterized protein LOC129104671 isoform X1 [Anoplopoma fimbria]